MTHTPPELTSELVESEPGAIVTVQPPPRADRPADRTLPAASNMAASRGGVEASHRHAGRPLTAVIPSTPHSLEVKSDHEKAPTFRYRIGHERGASTAATPSFSHGRRGEQARSEGPLTATADWSKLGTDPATDNRRGASPAKGETAPSNFHRSRHSSSAGPRGGTLGAALS